jgi:hypothetical protein
LEKVVAHKTKEKISKTAKKVNGDSAIKPIVKKAVKKSKK